MRKGLTTTTSNDPAILCLLVIASLAAAAAAQGSNRSSSSSSSNKCPVAMVPCGPLPPRPLTVYVLHVFSYYVYEASIDAAVRRFYEAYPQLRQQLDVQLVRKWSTRISATNAGEYTNYQLTLQATIRSLNYDNYTYLFISGPDGPAEPRYVALYTPLYNMITFSAVSTGIILKDRFLYPLQRFVCMSELEFGVSQAMFAQLLDFDKVALVALDQIIGERNLFIDQYLKKTSLQVVSIHVLNRETIESAASTLLAAQPDAILTSVGTFRGGQMLCNFYKLGIFPNNTVWMIAGLFSFTDWWARRPEQANWQCTNDEQRRILNGSLIVDVYNEPFDQDPKHVARRLDRLSNKDVLARINAERRSKYKTVNDNDMTSLIYYPYDTTFAALSAYIDSLEHYDSNEFLAWTDVLSDEIAKTDFYGATGRVTLNTGPLTGAMQIQQFQSYANSTDVDFVTVALVDFKSGTNQTWPEKLRFATETGASPLSVRRARARQTQIIAWSVGGSVALCVVLAVISALYIRYRRRSSKSDISWLITDAEQRIKYPQMEGSKISTISAISLGSSFSASNAGWCINNEKIRHNLGEASFDL